MVSESTAAPGGPESPATPPMTMTEKILARASGQASVRPGDVVVPDPELVIVHDGFIETAHRELSGIGYRSIIRPDRVAFVTDHEVAYTTPRAVERGRNNRLIAAEWGVGHFYDVGAGGHGHIFPMENGLVRPGMFLFAYDMHCTNFGAIGAFAMRAGSEVVAVLATGSLWTVVPGTVRVTLTGAFRDGVHARDLGFRLCGDLVSGKLPLDYDYKVVEFAGPAVEAMPLAARVALCNTLTEIGAINTLFPPLNPDGTPVSPELRALVTDEGAPLDGEVTIDLGDLSPQVALPGGPAKAAPIEQAAGRKVDHAFIGSCGSGMYEDFAVAGDLLRGRKVAPGVRFFIVPGTVQVARRLADEGLAQIFMEAGAVLLPPGCGPCAGGVMAPLGPGEVSVSTAATNPTGRLGSPDSEAYLASPITVAASAVAGCIVDPREAAGSGGRRPA